MDNSDNTSARKNEDVAFLTTVALFLDVPQHELQEIANLATTEHFMAGDMVLIEGEATNDLLIVREGTVEVYVSRQGKKIPITQLGPSSYFGEMSVFDDYPRSANVVAVTDVTAIRIDRDSLRTFLKANPAALFQMCRVFSHRLRNTNSALTKH